jgi:hypothetical protein
MEKGSFGCIGLLLLAEAGQAAMLVSTENRPITDPERFGAYGDNYAVYGGMSNSKWAERDESALRGHYSLGYIIRGRETDAGNFTIFAFSHTGEFDFYVGKRNSSPVINRISNPALHYVIYFDPDKGRGGGDVSTSSMALGRSESPFGYSRVDIALEHESNGQTTEVRTPEEMARADAAYAERDRYFFDSVSRGSNFLSITGELSQRGTDERSGSPIRVTATLRAYATQAYQVTWGPLAGTGAKLSDYNILRLGMHRYVPNWGIFGLTWTVGAGGPDKSSLDIDWQLDVFENHKTRPLPLYIRYHHGPLNTLSNYSQKQNSFGVGVKLAMY